ncbi:hypothetical protein [Nocardioides lijunqiniae]|uniref:hypothetical protein n=1 Tax=Nocardioides lijunqiniae TaxID=2760832 RepID=UPI001877CE7F|nr:hypothetical protein [Nocardioides lijunqiniae]
MRDDGDLAAYAAARWPSMIRTLVLLGVAPHRAAYVAEGAVARLRDDWRHRDELGDLDSHAFRVLLEARSRERDEAPDAAADHDLAPDDPDWPALRRRLERLPDQERAAAVLDAATDLAPDQVEAVLGDAARGPDDLREPLARAASAVPLPAFSFDDVVARHRVERRERRVRTARRAGVLALVVAVVAGGWTWWATRPGPPPGLSDVAVERRDNPAPVGWYADGTLRLDVVALRIEDLQSFARVPRGAVYADGSGEVVLVDSGGDRTRLGEQAPDGAFAASAPDGLVAWVDVAGEPELRVYDLAADEVVTSVPVAAATRVLAIDDGRVYVAGPDGAFVLEWEDESWSALARVSPDGLLDVAGFAAAHQADPQTVDLVHLQSGLDVSVPGTGAQVAPDGAHVLTRQGGPGGPVRLYDAFTGREVATGLAPGAQVYAAKLDGRGLATYLVELAQDDPADGPRLSNAGSLQLVSCPLEDPGEESTCTVHLTFPKSASWVLEQ